MIWGIKSQRFCSKDLFWIFFFSHKLIRILVRMVDPIPSYNVLSLHPADF